MPRNAFYETPPFSRIVRVKWSDETWSASWHIFLDFLSTAHFIESDDMNVCTDFVGDTPPTAGWDKDYPISCWWSLNTVFFAGSGGEGLVVSGAPTGPGQTTIAEHVGPGIALENPPDANVFLGETAPVVIGATPVGPVECWGNITELNGLQSIRGRFPLPANLSVSGGTIDATGITGTINGLPANKIRTEIAIGKFGAIVSVSFEPA